MPAHKRNRPIEAAILANENAPPPSRLSAVQLAEQLGITKVRIYKVREAMRKSGLLARAVHSPGMFFPEVTAPANLDPTSAAAVDQLLSSIREAGVLSEADIDRRLSVLADTAPANIRVAAMRLLSDRRRAVSGTVGPPAPATVDETVDRLVRLFLPLDRRLVEAAVIRAFEQPQPESVFEPPEEEMSSDEQEEQEESDVGE